MCRAKRSSIAPLSPRSGIRLSAGSLLRNVIYLIVGVDRSTFARWHDNVMAPDVSTANRIARARAAAQGIRLVVAAAIGPYATVVEESADAAAPRAA